MPDERNVFRDLLRITPEVIRTSARAYFRPLVLVYQRLRPKRTSSEAVTAALRRQKIAAVSRCLGALAALGTDDRFLFAVDAATKEIEGALREFATARREGNTREILRTLLNTLRNAGWERFRNPETAETVQAFLTGLATAEWIVPEQVERFHSLIDDLGMNPLTLPAGLWPE